MEQRILVASDWTEISTFDSIHRTDIILTNIFNFFLLNLFFSFFSIIFLLIFGLSFNLCSLYFSDFLKKCPRPNKHVSDNSKKYLSVSLFRGLKYLLKIGYIIPIYFNVIGFLITNTVSRWKHCPIYLKIISQKWTAFLFVSNQYTHFDMSMRCVFKIWNAFWFYCIFWVP